jgi:hypothetical protein
MTLSSNRPPLGPADQPETLALEVRRLRPDSGQKP